MSKIVLYVFFAVLAVACFAAPGQRVRRHYDGALGAFGGGGGGGYGGYGGHRPGGHRPGGHGPGAVPLHIGGSQSFSKSSASASSQSGGGFVHG